MNIGALKAAMIIFGAAASFKAADTAVSYFVSSTTTEYSSSRNAFVSAASAQESPEQNSSSETQTDVAEPENQEVSDSPSEPESTPLESEKTSETPVSELECPVPEELAGMIGKERELLNEQKKKIEAEAAQLELVRERISVELASLNELRTEVQGLLDRTQAQYNADTERLVTLYKNMKPKEAAALMNDMDIEVAVMVMGTMPERNAAPILAKMSPVRAQAISKIILERSKLPGDQDLVGIKLK